MRSRLLSNLLSDNNNKSSNSTGVGVLWTRWIIRTRLTCTKINSKAFLPNRRINPSTVWSLKQMSTICSSPITNNSSRWCSSTSSNLRWWCMAASPNNNSQWWEGGLVEPQHSAMDTAIGTTTTMLPKRAILTGHISLTMRRRHRSRCTLRQAVRAASLLVEGSTMNLSKIAMVKERGRWTLKTTRLVRPLHSSNRTLTSWLLVALEATSRRPLCILVAVRLQHFRAISLSLLLKIPKAISFPNTLEWLINSKWMTSMVNNNLSIIITLQARIKLSAREWSPAVTVALPLRNPQWRFMLPRVERRAFNCFDKE